GPVRCPGSIGSAVMQHYIMKTVLRLGQWNIGNHEARGINAPSPDHFTGVIGIEPHTGALGICDERLVCLTPAGEFDAAASPCPAGLRPVAQRSRRDAKVPPGSLIGRIKAYRPLIARSAPLPPARTI